MDYHHRKETHGARFLFTCSPLSTTGRVLDRMVRLSSLRVCLVLSRRIINCASEQTEQRAQLTGFATVRCDASSDMPHTFCPPKKKTLTHTRCAATILECLFLRYSLLAMIGDQIED
jgi:hypothetical protein